MEGRGVTTADDLAVAVFAAEWAFSHEGIGLSSGQVDVDDNARQAFAAASREGGRIWLAANPEHFMADLVRNWLGPEGVEGS
jgi:hypothetical protein